MLLATRPLSISSSGKMKLSSIDSSSWDICLLEKETTNGV